MRNWDVRFIQPDTLEEAQALLPTLTDRSVILAGGTDLMITIRDKRPHIDTYLSICHLNELKTVTKLDGWIRIGSMLTHAQTEEHPILANQFHALSQASASVGSKQIRNQGTLGGNVINGSVASDIIPCLCLYNGELEFLTPSGYQRITIDDYLQNRRQWQKAHHLLTYIYLPMKHSLDSTFVKLGSREEVTIAQISLCASWNKDDEGKKSVKLIMGGVSPIPIPYEPMTLLEGIQISESHAAELSTALREKISTLRKDRARPSKMRFTSAGQLYKERAVKGLTFDLVNQMNER